MAATVRCDTLQNAGSALANLTLDTSGNVTGGGTVADSTAILRPIVSGTIVTASGTAVTFTGIPSWAKRVTVTFNGVSSNGTSGFLLQIGAGSIQTTGYVGTTVDVAASGVGTISSVAGIPVRLFNAAWTLYGGVTFVTQGSNIWTAWGTFLSTTNQGQYTAGGVTLSGALSLVNITTLNGTDVFDAGTINILYE